MNQKEAKNKNNIRYNHNRLNEVKCMWCSDGGQIAVLQRVKIPLAASLSHTTDGTPSTQPAGWSCLAAKRGERPITVAEPMHNTLVFPVLVK